MYTPSRGALLGKTIPELVNILRMLGADSQGNESKDSLVNRILLFQPQDFKPDVKPVKKPIIALTEEQLRTALVEQIADGMTLAVRDGSWYISWGAARHDSGTLMQPITNVLRCAGYLKPRVWPEPDKVETSNPKEFAA